MFQKKKKTAQYLGHSKYYKCCYYYSVAKKSFLVWIHRYEKIDYGKSTGAIKIPIERVTN
jgi:hypothetical protein